MSDATDEHSQNIETFLQVASAGIDSQLFFQLAKQQATTRYTNRCEAGVLIAEVMQKRNVEYDMVVFIPKGGAIVAYEVARRLKVQYLIACPVQKVSSSFEDRCGIGALTVSGKPILNVNAQSVLCETPATVVAHIKKARSLQSKLKRKIKFDVGTLELVRQRQILVVDDGVATGFTMLAAVQSLRSYNPRLLDCAVPIASIFGVQMLAMHDLKLVVPYVEKAPIFLMDVYYQDFSSVNVNEVIALLCQYKDAVKR